LLKYCALLGLPKQTANWFSVSEQQKNCMPVHL
jgi:hypothetical protein